MFSNNYAIKQSSSFIYIQENCTWTFDTKTKRNSCKNLNSAHFQDLLWDCHLWAFSLIRLVKIEILISGTFQETVLKVKLSVFQENENLPLFLSPLTNFTTRMNDHFPSSKWVIIRQLENSFRRIFSRPLGEYFTQQLLRNTSLSLLTHWARSVTAALLNGAWHSGKISAIHSTRTLHIFSRVVGNLTIPLSKLGLSSMCVGQVSKVSFKFCALF